MMQPSRPARQRRPTVLVAVVVVIALGLGACTNSFVYNRLDTVARWYIGNLVSLNDTQQAALRSWLGRTLAWHRGSELKRYEAFLDELSAKVVAGHDAALLSRSVNQAEVFMRELAARVAPEAADLLTSLGPAQVDELLANLEKRNLEELEEERERSLEDRQKRRVRSLSRNLEKWTGAATPEQKDLIDRSVRDMNEAGLLGEDEEWFASQEAWSRALREALATPSGRARVEALLRDPEHIHTPGHRAAEAAERQAFVALFTAIDATLTEKQRTTLSARLAELARDLSSLQASRPAP